MQRAHLPIPVVLVLAVAVVTLAGACRGPADAHGAGEHGAVEHGAVEHGAGDNGTVEHGAADHGAVEHGTVEHGAAAAEPRPPQRFERTVASDADDRPLSYLLFEPAGPAPRDGHPLLLFLHGAGERGTDLARVEVHGPPKLVSTTAALWDCVLVAPQCPENTWWDTERVLALLDEVRATHDVDDDRIYVTGLSMGGFGTFELLATRPELFAAAVPICGGMREEREPAIVAAADVPIRVFHGAEDSLVPPDLSRRVVARLREAGADVELTIYSGVGHDAWTRTYADPELWEWLFAQRRGE